MAKSVFGHFKKPHEKTLVEHPSCFDPNALCYFKLSSAKQYGCRMDPHIEKQFRCAGCNHVLMYRPHHKQKHTQPFQDHQKNGCETNGALLLFKTPKGNNPPLFSQESKTTKLHKTGFSEAQADQFTKPLHLHIPNTNADGTRGEGITCHREQSLSCTAFPLLGIITTKGPSYVS